MFSKYVNNNPKTVPNNAGGGSYLVSDETRFDRFLILGIEGGSYYVAERDMAKSSIEFVKTYLESNFEKAMKRVAEISDAGRAIKNENAIFVLAVATEMVKDGTQRLLVETAVKKTIRTMSHLMMFVEYLTALEAGWGRWKRQLVSNWLNAQGVDQLAYQVAKYQSRNGWAVRDILRLAHPKATTAEYGAIYQWIVKGTTNKETPQYLNAVEAAKKADSAKSIVSLITEYNLVRENIPTQWLNEQIVWEALLNKMPITALVRNLGTMSKNGLLTPFSNSEKVVVHLLGNAEAIKKSRVHPFTLFLALKQYSAGVGFRGSNSWPVNPTIIAALEKAIELAYGNVPSTNKRIMYACDISGSMHGENIAGTNVSALEAEALLVTTLKKSEPLSHVYTFTTDFKEWQPHDSYDSNRRAMSAMRMGGTDCSIPLKYALSHKLSIDAFVYITDSETWANEREIADLLKEYRRSVNKDAKFIVLGMTATEFTVAPPNDPLSLDVVGMDGNVPTVLYEFIRD